MNNLLINKKKEIENIFREYADDIYRFAYSKTLDSTISEDIVSDTFITLLDVYEKYEDRGKIKSFLFGIALNKLRQYWITKKGKESIEFDEEIHNFQEMTPSLKRSRLFNKLIKIIDTLPDKYKLVIRLRFLELKSIKEVASTIGTTQSNVTTIQNRAIKKIKEKVNEK